MGKFTVAIDSKFTRPGPARLRCPPILPHERLPVDLLRVEHAVLITCQGRFSSVAFPPHATAFT